MPGAVSILAAVVLALAAVNSSCVAVYYGSVDPYTLDRLSRFHIVVLSPLVPGDAVRLLRSRGVIVLGYLSISSIGGWEPWAGNVSGSLVIGENRFWGERIVDVCKPEWRRVVLEAARYILSKGFSGVFLDNLDVVDVYPWMKPCIAGLVAELRHAYPDAKIMVNRGFSVLPDIAKHVDYVLFEDFITYYNASSGRYEFFKGRDLAWIRSMVETVHRLAGRYGVKLYLLAYAPPGNRSFLARLCTLWRQLDPADPLYVTTWKLDIIGVCNPCTTGTTSAHQPRGAGASWRAAATAAAALAVALLAATITRRLKARRATS